MLGTIVRALFVFVVFCLVSAVRPAPRPIYDNPHDARLEIAKSPVELATLRRDNEHREPRDQRALALGVPTPAFAFVAPPRTTYVLERHVVSRRLVPVIFARSSRGPPSVGRSS